MLPVARDVEAAITCQPPEPGPEHHNYIVFSAKVFGGHKKQLCIFFFKKSRTRICLAKDLRCSDNSQLGPSIQPQ